MNIEIHPVAPSRWSDFEELFESKGGPHYCWCMAWRKNELKKSLPGKQGKKACMKRRVDAGIPIGLVGYVDNRPVAWCSVAPRETYRKLGGDETLQDVWSVVCFFVMRQYRNRGFATALIDAALRYATENGAAYLEAYPVDPGSPSYRFMGLRPAFEARGFEYCGRAGLRRHVVRRALGTQG